MQFAHKHKQLQAEVQQQSGASSAAADPLKSNLRQVGFAEGSALLAPPVQAKEMPQLPATPGKAQPLATSPDQLPQLPQTPPEVAKAKEAAEAKKKAEAAAVARQKRINKWCVYGLDDPSAVDYCLANDASPERSASWLAGATSFLRVIKGNEANYKRFSKVMSDEDIIMVLLYTTQASYAMNAILRGQLKSKPWVDAYGKLAVASAKALKKAPKGAKNVQGKAGAIDPTQAAEKIVPIGTVYRSDGWSGFFNPVFASEYQTGRSLEERGFLSTTLVQGSYSANAPVRKTIEDAKVAREVADLSMVKSENEALFPPGQRFQIVSIECEDTKAGGRVAVSNPAQAFPKADYGDKAFNRPGLIWHVKLKHVGVAKGKKDKQPESTKDKKDKKTGHGAGDSGGLGGMLASMLGIG